MKNITTREESRKMTIKFLPHVEEFRVLTKTSSGEQGYYDYFRIMGYKYSEEMEESFKKKVLREIISLIKNTIKINNIDTRTLSYQANALVHFNWKHLSHLLKSSKVDYLHDVERVYWNYLNKGRKNKVFGGLKIDYTKLFKLMKMKGSSQIIIDLHGIKEIEFNEFILTNRMEGSITRKKSKGWNISRN